MRQGFPAVFAMKILFQFCIIALFSFLGELLHTLIPFPIPAAIYGLVLLFLALFSGLLKTDQVRETSDFLVSLLPLLFVAPLVGIVGSLRLIVDNLVPILTVLVVGTVVTFAVSGSVTQFVLAGKRRKQP